MSSNIDPPTMTRTLSLDHDSDSLSGYTDSDDGIPYQGDEIAHANCLPYESVHDFLNETVPVGFAHPQDVYQIRDASNRRLQLAYLLNIPVRDITISEVDCLPDWEGRPLDSRVHIQLAVEDAVLSRLAATNMGDLVSSAIIRIGTQRLAQAAELGISLEYLFYDRRLVVQWLDYPARDCGTITDHEAPRCRDPFVRMECAALGSAIADGQELEISDGLYNALRTAYENRWLPITESSSDSESSSLSTGTPRNHESDEEWNIFDEANGYNLGNGASFGPIEQATTFEGLNTQTQTSVQFNVVAAHDAGEVDELPEMELAIDADAVDAHFEADDEIAVSLDRPVFFVENPDSPSAPLGSSEFDDDIDYDADIDLD